MSKYVGQEVSKRYRVFRPQLSPVVVERVLEYLTKKIPLDQCSIVVDAGCGTGLATAPFAKRLPSNVQICGFDSSQTQIEEAQKSSMYENVKYSVQNMSSSLPFPDNHVDMITAVQAAHWFDLGVFFAECKRVLKPSGVIALIGYTLPNIEVANATHEVNVKLCGLIQKLDDDLYEGGFWQPTIRPKVVGQYQLFELPFEDQACYRNDESLYSREETTLQHFFDFLETWCRVRTYRIKYPEGPLLKEFYENFMAWLPEGTEMSSTAIQIIPWFMVMCRKI